MDYNYQDFSSEREDLERSSDDALLIIGSEQRDADITEESDSEHSEPETLYTANDDKCVVCYGSLLEQQSIREMLGISVLVPCTFRPPTYTPLSIVGDLGGHVMHTECAQRWISRCRSCMVCRTAVQSAVRTFGYPSVDQLAPASKFTAGENKLTAELNVKCSGLELENSILRADLDKYQMQLAQIKSQLALVKSEQQSLLQKNAQLNDKNESLERRYAARGKLLEKTKLELERNRLKQQERKLRLNYDQQQQPNINLAPVTKLAKPFAIPHNNLNPLSALRKTGHLIRTEVENGNLPAEDDLFKTPSVKQRHTDGQDNSEANIWKKPRSPTFSPDPVPLSRVQHRGQIRLSKTQIARILE